MTPNVNINIKPAIFIAIIMAMANMVKPNPIEGDKNFQLPANGLIGKFVFLNSRILLLWNGKNKLITEEELFFILLAIMDNLIVLPLENRTPFILTIFTKKFQNPNFGLCVWCHSINFLFY